MRHSYILPFRAHNGPGIEPGQGLLHPIVRGRMDFREVKQMSKTQVGERDGTQQWAWLWRPGPLDRPISRPFLPQMLPFSESAPILSLFFSQLIHFVISIFPILSSPSPPLSLFSPLPFSWKANLLFGPINPEHCFRVFLACFLVSRVATWMYLLGELLPSWREQLT